MILGLLSFCFSLQKNPFFLFFSWGYLLHLTSFQIIIKVQFEYDILISFSPLDNQNFSNGEEGWVTELRKSLEVRLTQLIGRKPIIHSDETESIGNIQEKPDADASKYALIIPVLSKWYIRGEGGISELESFCLQRNGGKVIQVSNLPYVFKVLKNGVKQELHPGSIQQNLEYCFFERDSETGNVKEFSPSLLNQTEKQYWGKLDDLANDIAEFLKLSGQLSGEGDVNNGNGLTIYLAETSNDSLVYRDVIKRELIDNGHNILPKKPLTAQMPVVYAEAMQNINQAALSIHILGSDFGIVPEGSNRSMNEIQNDVADEIMTKTGGRRIIWIPENVVASDERQKILIDDIRSSMKGIGNAEVVVGDLEVCKSVIDDTIKRIKIEKEQRLNEGNNLFGKAIIYLIYDIFDQALVQPVTSQLKMLGCDVVTSVDGTDETEIRNKHIENLKHCDAVVLYYGNGSELWLQSRLRDLLRIPAYGRKKPKPAKAILLGLPRNERKFEITSKDAVVFNCIDHIDTEGIKGWISNWIK